MRPGPSTATSFVLEMCFSTACLLCARHSYQLWALVLCCLKLYKACWLFRAHFIDVMYDMFALQIAWQYVSLITISSSIVVLAQLIGVGGCLIAYLLPAKAQVFT